MKRYSICINDIFCLILDKKNLIYPQISQEFGYFNDQNILNLDKNVLFEESCNQNEWYDMYRIAKVSI